MKRRLNILSDFLIKKVGIASPEKSCSLMASSGIDQQDLKVTGVAYASHSHSGSIGIKKRKEQLRFVSWKNPEMSEKVFL